MKIGKVILRQLYQSHFLRSHRDFDYSFLDSKEDYQ